MRKLAIDVFGVEKKFLETRFIGGAWRKKGVVVSGVCPLIVRSKKETSCTCALLVRLSHFSCFAFCAHQKLETKKRSICPKKILLKEHAHHKKSDFDWSFVGRRGFGVPCDRSKGVGSTNGFVYVAT